MIKRDLSDNKMTISFEISMREAIDRIFEEHETLFLQKRNEVGRQLLLDALLILKEYIRTHEPTP